jgi:hypothetical protein
MLQRNGNINIELGGFTQMGEMAGIMMKIPLERVRCKLLNNLYPYLRLPSAYNWRIRFLSNLPTLVFGISRRKMN